MRFPFYIAQRYLKSKSGNNIINIVTILACLGVMAGTIALFVVLSVFSGIKDYSLKILDANTPDIRITAKKGKTFIANKQLTAILEESVNNFTYAKILEERVFLKSKDKEAIAYIKGVDSLYNRVVAADSLLMVGEWLSPKINNSCVADYALVRELDLNVYTDRVLTYVPKAGKGYISNPKKAFRTINPQLIGVVSNQNQQGYNYIYAPLTLSQQLLGKQKNEVSAIDLKLNDAYFLNDTYKYLTKNLANDYTILKREEINSSFYKILNSEKLIAYLVSLLVLMMVLSNTSGTIIMVIVDKKENIKTLLNLGATVTNIRKIFTLYGFLLNLVGMLIGLLVGAFIIYLQISFELVMIAPNIPYPVAFEWQNVGVVCCTIVVFGALASLLASGRISNKYLN